jgi:hypothetical protein
LVNKLGYIFFIKNNFLKNFSVKFIRFGQINRIIS